MPMPMPMHDGKDLYSLRDKNGKSILTASKLPGSRYDRFDEVKTKGNASNPLIGLKSLQSTHVILKL